MMLELDDIQGLILGGFNTNFQILVALTMTDPTRPNDALAWLASLSAEITTVTQVRQTRQAMKEVAPAAPPYWLGVAVGARIVDALGDLYLLDAAFNGGMVQRARSILGDFTDPAGWTVGKPADPVDILLVIGSNDRVAAETGADQLIARGDAMQLRASYRETGVRLPDEREHFGFRDGISQPKISGFDAGGTLGAGNFIFGYPAENSGPIILPVRDARKLAPNGSLLVVRRLKQDVASFQDFCAQEAKRISSQWAGITAEHLAALIVGRWPSGSPVRQGVDHDPGSTPGDNDFDFRDDPNAANCPFAAHVRKVNPREGARDEVNVPRLIRRGIPFGGADDEDHGLLFLAFQSAIPDQFEKLTRKWMNGAISPNPGNDLLVGRSLSARTMDVTGPGGPIKINDGSRQWITPTGGAYLFAPGRNALAKFADPPSASLLWNARTFVAKRFDRLADLFTTALRN